MTKVAELEALLFVEGAELKKKEIAKLLEIDETELASVSRTLSQVLSGHGITIVESDSTLALRSAPEVAGFIKKVHEKSIEGDLGKAGLETLSILFYRGPSTRSEIDYIRGVNSSSSVRALLMRGLIEREKSGSVYVYKSSVDALAFLGVSRVEDLPEFERMQSELKKLENKEEVTQDVNNE